METFKLISLLLSFWFLNIAEGDNSNEDSSWVDQKIQALEDAVQKAGCQQYLAQGYGYEHMYRIDGVAFDNTMVEMANDELIEFEMHLAIKTIKDGIILLSPLACPGAHDLVFEIAVGIANNHFTALRIRKDSGDEVARVYTPGILSTNQYTKFYIKMSDGVLTFGKEDDNSPIITYYDIRLKTVKYFGVSSWRNVEGKFLFDCPAAKAGSTLGLFGIQPRASWLSGPQLN